MTAGPDLSAWSRHLRDLAAPALRGTPLDPGAPRGDPGSFIDGFADERGHRRAVDRPLLAWMLGTHPGRAPAQAGPDLLLWWALHDPVIDPWRLVDPGPGGALLGSQRRGIIETDTEAELAAIHGAWHAARSRGDERLRDRVLGAARALIDTVQPDNATGHPWAVHVLVMLGTGADLSAGLYAQTLVHNALVGEGRVERFSACLLLDAAAALDREAARA